METKDWITLFLPLVGNGVVLFVLQQTFLAHIKHAEQKNDYQKQVLIEFTSLLHDFFACLHGFRGLYMDPESSQEFSDIWNPANNLMQQLVLIRDTHPVILKKANKHFDLCIKQWNELSKFLRNVKYSQANLDDCFYRRIENECFIMQERLRSCLEVCEKQLLKL